MAELLPLLKPIPIKDRLSVLYIEKGQLDVLDSAFVVVDKTGVRTHIPIGGVACLMLEPGTRVSHAACALAARVGTLLVWIGEAGVRLYSAGQPGGARADRLLYLAKLALDPDLRLKVVRNMYAMRFGEEPPQRRSVERHRGRAGTRNVQADCCPIRRRLEGPQLRYPRLGQGRLAQSMPVVRDLVSIRSIRSCRAGGGLRAGRRLHSYREAVFVRLRRGRCLQVRNSGAGRLPDRVP